MCDAAEAERMGFLTRVVEDEDLDEAVAINVVFAVDHLGAGYSHCGGKNKQRERKEQGCSPDRVGHFVISKQLS